MANKIKHSDKRDAELRDLLTITAEQSNVHITDMSHPTKKRTIADARKIYCYIAWANGRYSMREIGAIIGRKHCSVHAATKEADNLKTRDTTFGSTLSKVQHRWRASREHQFISDFNQIPQL